MLRCTSLLATVRCGTGSVHPLPTGIRPSLLLHYPTFYHILPPTTLLYYPLLRPTTAYYCHPSLTLQTINSSNTLLLFDCPPSSIHPPTTWPLCQQPYRLFIPSALKRYSMYKYYPYTYKVLHVHTLCFFLPFSLLQYSPWGLIDILSQPVGPYIHSLA